VSLGVVGVCQYSNLSAVIEGDIVLLDKVRKKRPTGESCVEYVWVAWDWTAQLCVLYRDLSFCQSLSIYYQLMHLCLRGVCSCTRRNYAGNSTSVQNDWPRQKFLETFIGDYHGHFSDLHNALHFSLRLNPVCHPFRLQSTLWHHNPMLTVTLSDDGTYR